MSHIQIVADGTALTIAAADFIRDRALLAIAERGRFTIALAGGSTPKPIYERLSQPPYSTDIDWAKVEVFFGDERCVPPDNPNSNWHMALAALGKDLTIPNTSYHRMRGEDPPEDAAKKYEALLADRFAANDRLDLVLLGMGDNGHTASLFPGLPAITETTRRVMAQYVEVAGMWRLTLTPVAINAARGVLFLVAGPAKAEMLARVLEGPPDPIVLPSQTIAPTSGDLHWLVDAAAAAQLKATA